MAVSAEPGSSRLGEHTFCEPAGGNYCSVQCEAMDSCTVQCVVTGSGSSQFFTKHFAQTGYFLLSRSLNKLIKLHI